ncbi:hypothetical protein R6Q57_008610 [Mikania cordata]
MRTTLDDSFINDDDTEDDDENASNSDEENEIDVDDDEDDDIVDTCYSRMTTYIARGHGGDGSDRPPPNDPKRIPTPCESSQPKIRSKGKNIKLIKNFEKNHCKPLPNEVEDEGGQYKFVGENCSDFIRLISNEVGKVAPFHYTSWQNVPDQFKKSIFPTLFEYFDLDSLRNTDQWEGTRLRIHAECQRAYKDRKQELKKHFDSVGGYEDVEKARTKPQKNWTSRHGNNSLISCSLIRILGNDQRRIN